MVKRLRAVYNIIFFLCVPLLLVRIFWRGWRDRAYRQRWQERFSCKLPAAPSQRPVWIHAVSVGETVAATPIVNHLRDHFPTLPILFTTTTPTGAAAAMNRFGESILQVFFPYDLPHVVSRYVEHFNPRLLILMETELWPNLLNCCQGKNIPVLIANARLSEKSASRYRRFPSITGTMLSSIDCFAVQSKEDRDRFLSLGAANDLIEVTGSLKFDVELPPSTAESGQALRRFLGTNRAVVMAGSTRDGEEELLLETFKELRNRYPDLLLLIAPRHPERFDIVADLCRKERVRVSRKSFNDPCTSEIQVYLIDSMGELPSFYAAADVAFVGGSLLPYGGHNVLEPAALGIPVVVGRYTYNFSDIVAILRSVGALTIADKPSDIGKRLEEWLNNSDARDRAGTAGRDIVMENRGAAAKVMQIVAKMISASAEPVS